MSQSADDIPRCSNFTIGVRARSGVERLRGATLNAQLANAQLADQLAASSY